MICNQGQETNYCIHTHQLRNRKIAIFLRHVTTNYQYVSIISRTFKCMTNSLILQKFKPNVTSHNGIMCCPIQKGIIVLVLLILEDLCDSVNDPNCITVYKAQPIILHCTCRGSGFSGQPEPQDIDFFKWFENTYLHY